MITFRLYYEAVNKKDVEPFGGPRLERELILTPEEIKMDGMITHNISLKDYNAKQVQAILKYIQRVNSFEDVTKAEQRFLYLMNTYPKEMGIKMKLYLSAHHPELFDYKTVSS